MGVTTGMIIRAPRSVKAEGCGGDRMPVDPFSGGFYYRLNVVPLGGGVGPLKGVVA